MIDKYFHLIKSKMVNRFLIISSTIFISFLIVFYCVSNFQLKNYTENTECICNRGYNFLFDSDAHYLWQINENNGENFIECDTLTKKYLINMLNQKK